MMSRSRSLIQSTEGASAVEFAFIIGPLLLFLLGSFEFGRLLWTREALQETATAAARCMGVLQSSCSANGAYSSVRTTSYVQTLASQWAVAVPASGIILTQNATCAGVNGFSQVSISYVFQSVAPLLITALSGGVTLSTSACFPNQN